MHSYNLKASTVRQGSVVYATGSVPIQDAACVGYRVAFNQPASDTDPACPVVGKSIQAASCGSPPEKRDTPSKNAPSWAYVRDGTWDGKQVWVQLEFKSGFKSQLCCVWDGNTVIWANLSQDVKWFRLCRNGWEHALPWSTPLP